MFFLHTTSITECLPIAPLETGDMLVKSTAAYERQKSPTGIAFKRITICSAPQSLIFMILSALARHISA